MPRVANHLRARRAGLTLAELSVSLAIIATLMVAIGSIMALTGRAVGMTASQAGESRIDDLVATMASEQRMALSVNELTPTSVTFTVADRNHDGVPEKIAYFLSSDGKLMRQMNDATAVAILTDVTKFSLGWIPKVAAAAGPVPQVESTTDELLFAHETGLTSGQSMSTTSWAAQSFKPTLVRRRHLLARHAGPDHGQPHGAVYDDRHVEPCAVPVGRHGQAQHPRAHRITDAGDQEPHDDGRVVASDNVHHPAEPRPQAVLLGRGQPDPGDHHRLRELRPRVFRHQRPLTRALSPASGPRTSAAT